MLATRTDKTHCVTLMWFDERPHAATCSTKAIRRYPPPSMDSGFKTVTARGLWDLALTESQQVSEQFRHGAVVKRFEQRPFVEAVATEDGRYEAQCFRQRPP